MRVRAYVVHTRCGAFRCRTLRLAAMVRRAMGGHVVAASASHYNRSTYPCHETHSANLLTLGAS